MNLSEAIMMMSRVRTALAVADVPGSVTIRSNDGDHTVVVTYRTSLDKMAANLVFTDGLYGIEDEVGAPKRL